MKKIITILLLALCSFSYSQNKMAENVIDSGTATSDKEDTKIYSSSEIEVRAEFKEGKEKMNEFIFSKFVLPNEIVEKNLKGQITTTFVVEKDGSLTDIKVIKDVGFDTGKEMTRVLKLMPKWYPAELNGKKVRVLFTLIYAPNGGN